MKNTESTFYKISIILNLVTLWFVVLVFTQTDTPTSNKLIMLIGPIADLLTVIIPGLALISASLLVISKI